MEKSPAAPVAGRQGTLDEEAALVRAARAEPAAFGALYQRYLPRVYGYLRARAASDDDAADLTQQVFLRALEALPAYRERGLPFAAWLFRIARNAATDAHRRRRATVPWDALPAALQPAASDDPEAGALRREALGQLGAALAALDPDKRELLALRFAARLTAREIAAVVGKSEGATKKQLARTLHALKEHYREG
ncbi:MAG TPA: sigma-70 family RNA polymerase sigma factor [Thermomicrobiales bacterium]|nr:sigma-70 family RNA polymerase sigma factor [Thermomicrobiales bacterium]